MARKKTPLDAVQFTRESAERIAGIVRAAELTPPQATPLTFEPYLEGRHPKQVRAAMFSGAWPIGSSKVVTFSNLPTATATVQNISWPITNNGYANEPCVVGRDGTSWYLLVPRLQTATSVIITSTRPITFVSQTQARTVLVGPISVSTTAHTATCSSISDVQLHAQLNTSDCSISISSTLVTSECSYLSSIDVAAVATSAVVSVCGAVDTGIVISGTAAASFLRVRVP